MLFAIIVHDGWALFPCATCAQQGLVSELPKPITIYEEVDKF
jgi:hypothetical protein